MNYLNLDPKDYSYFIDREIKDDDKLWNQINDVLSRFKS